MSQRIYLAVRRGLYRRGEELNGESNFCCLLLPLIILSFVDWRLDPSIRFNIRHSRLFPHFDAHVPSPIDTEFWYDRKDVSSSGRSKWKEESTMAEFQSSTFMFERELTFSGIIRRYLKADPVFSSLVVVNRRHLFVLFFCVQVTRLETRATSTYLVSYWIDL